MKAYVATVKMSLECFLKNWYGKFDNLILQNHLKKCAKQIVLKKKKIFGIKKFN